MTSNGFVRYETELGEVKLSPEIIKRYLVSGDPDKVTDQEVMMFLTLCRYQRLNPFLREAYLIKFGNNPATIVTGKETFTKRAAATKKVKGWEAGVVVLRKEELEHRAGTLVLPGEELVGGWAKVYRDDWAVPLEITVSLSEYQRRRKDGQLMSNWANMPGTMIRKVALVQALREVMPTELGGLYSPEEMPVDDSLLDTTPIGAPQLAPAPAPKQDQQQERNRLLKELQRAVSELDLQKDAADEIMAELFPGKTGVSQMSNEELAQLVSYLSVMIDQRAAEVTEEELDELTQQNLAEQ